jgi:hypothetical protein
LRELALIAGGTEDEDLEAVGIVGKIHPNG